MHEDTIIGILKENGIDFVSSLPCDKARDLCFLLPDRFPHVALTREEDGVGVSAGAYLAGKRPAMVIQSSGLGNMLNALMSLTRTCDLPLPVIASWRGVYNETIPAQIPFNRAVPKILEAVGIPYAIISDSRSLGDIAGVIRRAYEEKTPAVALLSPRCMEGDGASPWGACGPGPLPSRSREMRFTYTRTVREPALTRYGAIREAAAVLSDEAVVANIGIPSRELYAVRDRDLNFYMLGSYTQASPIGLGIALGSHRDVVVFDGDGSILGTGILPVIAGSRPENLTIVCLDNGVFGSTGNQPTQAYGQADLELLAIASGFRNTCKVQTDEEIREALTGRRKGPNFVHAIIRPGNADVPNIPLSPAAIRDRFMAALGTNVL
jgi:sulfopyruvate decarboxylase subunit beta